MDTLVTVSGKKAGLIFLMVLMIAALICLIVNYSVNGSISWSLFPLAGLMLLWVLIGPLLFFKENRVLISYIGFAIAILPFLYGIQWLVPLKGWFIPLALPIALVVIIALGMILVIFKFFSNKVIAVSVALFLIGVLVNYSVDRIVSQFLGEQGRYNEPGRMVMWISALLASVVLFFGFLKKNKGSEI